MIYCHTYVSAIFLLAIFCKINAGEIEENDTNNMKVSKLKLRKWNNISIQEWHEEAAMLGG